METLRRVAQSSYRGVTLQECERESTMVPFAERVGTDAGGPFLFDAFDATKYWSETRRL